MGQSRLIYPVMMMIEQARQERKNGNNILATFQSAAFSRRVGRRNDVVRNNFGGLTAFVAGVVLNLLRFFVLNSVDNILNVFDVSNDAVIDACYVDGVVIDGRNDLAENLEMDEFRFNNWDQNCTTFWAQNGKK